MASYPGAYGAMGKCGGFKGGSTELNMELMIVDEWKMAIENAKTRGKWRCHVTKEKKK